MCLGIRLSCLRVDVLMSAQIWKTLKLPLDNPTKPECQTILYAIEELYFYRRYVEAWNVAQDVLKGKLKAEFKAIVEGYRAKCVGLIGRG